MNLDQMIINAKAGDKEAMEEIIEKFNPLVIKMAASTYIAGYDFDDLKQIGYLSIMRAVKMIDMNRSTNFDSYIYQAVKRNFYYEIRRKVRDQYVTSLNKPGEEGGELGDVLSCSFDMEEDYVKRDELKRLIDTIDSLGDEERELILYLLKFHKGGLTRYSKDKSISYTTCINKRKSIFTKIKNRLENNRP
jgi:RNA polymerase sporulation-specific sigma factor